MRYVLVIHGHDRAASELFETSQPTSSGGPGRVLTRIGEVLAAYLSHPIRGFVPLATYSAAQLRAALEPADVLLVEGISASVPRSSTSHNRPGRTRHFTWVRRRGNRQ